MYKISFEGGGYDKCKRMNMSSLGRENNFRSLALLTWPHPHSFYNQFLTP